MRFDGTHGGLQAGGLEKMKRDMGRDLETHASIDLDMEKIQSMEAC